MKIKMILRKYGLNVLIILAEIASIVMTFLYLTDLTRFLWLVAYIVNFIVYLWILNLDTNPEFKIPWISIVLLIQPLGSLLYAMFSERKLTSREVRHMTRLRNVLPASDKNADKFSEDDGDTALASGKAKAILSDDPQAEIFSDTDSEYFALGEEMYEKMLADLRQAENFIFLEYFIVEEGVMWDSILEILKERVTAGVEVRMLYDDIGCMATLDGKYDRRLREAGIQCYKFNPFRPDASEIHNNRDHRKLLIIDGQIGYTGGINLADEYINSIQKYGHWKDGGIRLEGAAVKGMTRLFLVSWDNCRETISDYERYLKVPKLPERSRGYYIPFGSGPKPAYFNPVGKNVFLNLINQAKKSLYITTPYLIIDYDLTNALQNAAKRGVDVKIITPHIPDRKTIQLMTRSSYPSLLESGVKIYEYAPGFIHAKNVIADDEYAVVGTINFDYRSLVHHYENAVWMYKTTVIPAMKKDFLNTEEKSIKIEQSTIKISPAQKVLKYCIRLFVPLM